MSIAAVLCSLVVLEPQSWSLGFGLCLILASVVLIVSFSDLFWFWCIFILVLNFAVLDLFMSFLLVFILSFLVSVFRLMVLLSRTLSLPRVTLLCLWSLSPFWNLLILVSKPQSYLEISVLFLVFESPSLESCQFLIMILLLLVLLIWHCPEPDALRWYTVWQFVWTNAELYAVVCLYLILSYVYEFRSSWVDC